MLEFSLRHYKKSISELRHAVGVGVPENRDGDFVEVESGPNHFRFNVADIYLTHQKPATSPDWQEIKRHNYSQMGILDSFEISGGKIRRAFDVTSPENTDLALVIIASSEAVRSRVVYQMVQQMLGRPQLRMSWGELKPLLIGSWIHNIEENNKRRPIKYGALGPLDYYNTEAKSSIRSITSAGFRIE